MGEPVTEIRSDINRPVPPGWQRLHSDEGTYYWHSATDTSQWEYPSQLSMKSSIRHYSRTLLIVNH